MACLLLGLLHKRDKYTWSVFKFQWEETRALRHAPANTHPQTRQDFFLKLRPVAGENFQICDSHIATLWIIELSCSSWSTLWCAQWVSYLSNSPLHTHTWLQASSCMFLKVEQMGLSTAPRFISCCFEMCSLDGFFYFSNKARSHHCTFHLFCFILSIGYPNKMTLMTRLNEHPVLLFIPRFHSELIGGWQASHTWAIICRTVLMSHHSGYMTQ